MLAHLTMDPPTGEEHEAMRDQKAGLLKAVRPLDAGACRAWAISRLSYGRRAYAPIRRSKPIVAVKLFIDNWRWAGVPIYIRAGKCLPVTATEVSVEFRRPPRETFGELVPAARRICGSGSAPTWRSAWACG